MIPSLKQTVPVSLIVLALATLCFASQSPAQSTPPPQPQPALTPQTAPQTTTPQPAPRPTRTLILLDPAHGGPDTGARLPNNLLEKDITLAFNNRLRAALSAASFAVISTRTSDPTVVFTTDQRAEIVNHNHPALCLVLHVTSSGSGVHLFTSSLTPASPTRILHWNTAQAPAISASRDLANQIGSALTQAKLPVILGQASVPPLDNLTSPAIAIELAPLPAPTADATPTPASDAAYQQRVAEAIVSALTHWRADNAPDGAAQ